VQQSGQLNSPMVPEGVPPVACSKLCCIALHACCQRVGVKRSRERTDQPVTAPVPVRPALDADPVEPVRAPIMEDEERAPDWRTKISRSSSRLPTWRPFPMGAAVGGSTAIAVDIDVRSKDSGVSPTTFVSRPSRHPRPYMDCYVADDAGAG
jgi:hypothetical protein